MSSAGERKGQIAATHGQAKPHSHNFTVRQQIAKGWKAGGGN